MATYQALRSCVHRTQAQIGREHFPDDLGLEPHVRFCTARLDVAARLVCFQRLQGRVVCRQCFLTKPPQSGIVVQELTADVCG